MAKHSAGFADHDQAAIKNAGLRFIAKKSSQNEDFQAVWIII